VAWLLAQHADRDPVLDRAFLEALRGALAHGEASPAHLAWLEDRVRVRTGQPQLHGTQFTATGRGIRALSDREPTTIGRAPRSGGA
jgi:hypothetical protein